VWKKELSVCRKKKKRGGGNKLDFSKRRKYSTRRGKKFKQGKVSQFKSVKVFTALGKVSSHF
jgi:hypothetical protein